VRLIAKRNSSDLACSLSSTFVQITKLHLLITVCSFEFSDINISQSSVATRLRSGGMLMITLFSGLFNGGTTFRPQAFWPPLCKSQICHWLYCEHPGNVRMKTFEDRVMTTNWWLTVLTHGIAFVFNNCNSNLSRSNDKYRCEINMTKPISTNQRCWQCCCWQNVNLDIQLKDVRSL